MAKYRKASLTIHYEGLRSWWCKGKFFQLAAGSLQLCSGLMRKGQIIFNA